MKYFNIAIDGPAGSGKSTVAKEFASRHQQFLYINTGAMFRTYGLYLLNNKVDLSNEELIKSYLPKISVLLEGEKVFLLENESHKKTEVTDIIKEMNVAKAASCIANLKSVREKLLLDQRAIANTNHVIMDGRDIGTVVLPHADLKIYLLASSDERATRRLKELKELNPHQEYDFLNIKKEIDERDFQDMNRAIAPLKKAEDAIVLNTDGMNIQECCDAIEKLYYNLVK